eukprot:194437_1
MASKKKLTKADLKRMEDLSAKHAKEKKANEIEKRKLEKVKKELESEKRKLATQWKELKNQTKQAQIDKDFKAGVASKNAKKGAKGGGGGAVKKLQKDLLEMKTKFNAEGKRARNFKQEVDQLTAENKVLQKKLKNLQGRKEKGEDPRIRNLQRENKQLKKQIKMLMIELNKKRRWFQRCIKSFKSSRQKWIKTQEDTLKKKGFLIKYVFLDDVKQIKAYKEKGAKKGKGKGKGRFKNKIKVKSRDGGVIVLKDVEFVVLDGDDFDAEDGTAKGKKKGKKSKGDQLDEMEQYLAELEAEIQADQQAIGGGDDYKDIDSDEDFDLDEDVGDLDGDVSMDQLVADAQNDADEDDGDDAASDTSKKTGKSGGKSPRTPTTPGGKKSNKKGLPAQDLLGLPAQHSIDGSDNAVLSAHLVYLMKELDDRTDDVEKMKEIVSDSEKYPDPVSEMASYMAGIEERGQDVVDKLDGELHADKGDIEQMKANNDRWLLWLNNLSQTMANNGALFNELLGVFEYYLKELKGRMSDLSAVNQVIYVDKKEDKEFDALKEGVKERHDEVEGEFESIDKKKEDSKEEEEEEDAYDEDKEKKVLDANADKVKEIRDGLVANNTEWRELVESVASDYDLSSEEKRKLVQNINDSNTELKQLIDLVQKIPKRKILETQEEEDEPAEEEEKENDEEDQNEEEEEDDNDD